MARTRVGIFTTDFHPCVGGIGMFTVDLYQRLMQDAEFEPVVFSPMENDFPNHVRLEGISSRTLGPLYLSFKVSALLGQLVRRHSLDVLHFLGSSGGVQLLRRPPRPAVFTLHNTYFYLSRQYGGAVFRVLREVERQSLRHADFVVPASHGVRGELPLPDAPNLRVIQNGIDTQLFRPRDVRRERYFLYLGRLGERKGVLDLVEAFAQARCEGFELRLAGSGPLRDEIPALAERLGVRERVKMLGYVSRDALPDLYASAHAVVLPSWAEGFPLTVAEAMACGALFIGSRIPGIIEQIDHGKNGLLAEPRDVASLAACLKQAATLDGAALDALRANAAESGRARSTDVMVDHYRTVYRSLAHR